MTHKNGGFENVIKRVQNDTSNIPTRLSVNFYRDQADDYVVRPYEFSTDINTQLAYLNREYANGGGDYEEAVEEALEDAINNHSWDETSIKILFLVLDAPPHNTESIKESLKDSIAKVKAPASDLATRQLDLKYRQTHIGGCWANYDDDRYLKWFERRNN